MNKKINIKGNRKTIYQNNFDNSSILDFSDMIYSYKQKKYIEVPGKGILTNSISSHIFNKLSNLGIQNHFVKKTNMRQQLITEVETLPLQVHISTIAFDRYVEHFDIEEGLVFQRPMIDFRINSQKLGYPSINEYQLINFNWLDKYDIKEIIELSIRITDFLNGLFLSLGIRLIDLKLEFGRIFNNELFDIMLVDEISPDNCRLWSMEDNKKLSFEIIDETDNPDDLIKSYKHILKLLQGNSL